MMTESWTDDVAAVAGVVGRATAKAGVFIGKKAAAAFRAVDYDVWRHAAHVPLLAWSLFVPRRDKMQPGIPDGRQPLVFVHGLGGNRGNFLPLELYLNHLGRRRTYKTHFPLGSSIDDMARNLADFVGEVKKVTGEPRVDLVAHSLGGLTARLAIADYGLHDSVGTLITMGTPHHGTYPARFANTPATLDLRPDSDLIRRLNASPLPAGMKAVTFWSRNDLFVLPSDSANLPGAEQVELTPFTHYSYLIDPRCWAAAARFLT